MSRIPAPGAFGAKMRALMEIEQPVERLASAITKKRGETARRATAKAIGNKNAKEILAAEIRALAEDIPEDALNSFDYAPLRSALFEVYNEKISRIPLSELKRTKEMLDAARRNLGMVWSSAKPIRKD